MQLTRIKSGTVNAVFPTVRGNFTSLMRIATSPSSPLAEDDLVAQPANLV